MPTVFNGKRLISAKHKNIFMIFLLWVVRNEIGILIKTKIIENKTHQNQIGESKFFEFPSNVIGNFLVFDDGRYLGQFDFWRSNFNSASKPQHSIRGTISFEKFCIRSQVRKIVTIDRKIRLLAKFLFRPVSIPNQMDGKSCQCDRRPGFM